MVGLRFPIACFSIEFNGGPWFAFDLQWLSMVGHVFPYVSHALSMVGMCGFPFVFRLSFDGGPWVPFFFDIFYMAGHAFPLLVDSFRGWGWADFPLFFNGFSRYQRKVVSKPFVSRRKVPLRSSLPNSSQTPMTHKGSADFSPLGVRAVALVRDTVVKIKRKFKLLGYSTFETLSGES